MASPQKENGFTAIANEIIEHLLMVQKTGKEADCLLFVIRKTYGFQKKTDRISLTQFEKSLRMSRRGVCSILKRLVKRRLLVGGKGVYGFNKNWEEWVVNASSLVKRSSPPASEQRVQSASERQFTHKRKNTKERTIKETSVAKAPQEDLRKIVNKYFDLQSYEEADRKASFPRHVRDAKALLQACGGDSRRAVAVLDALHAWAAGKHLSYSIGTALKQWQRFSRSEPAATYEAKMARVQAEIDKYSKQTP